MPHFVNSVASEALLTLVYLMAPPVLVALIVGLVVGVFQAATSINEMTLSFVPKIVAVVLVMTFMGPGMMDRCRRLFMLIFDRIQAISQ